MKLQVFAALALCALGATAQAQTYPTKTVRIIVPFAPGGGSDFIARAVAPSLSKAMGQQFVVDNRPGAGSTLGSEIALKSPADGYTLLLISGSYTTSPSLYKNLKYDTLNDMASVVQTENGPYVISTHPSLPVKNVRELIVFAKARPGDILFAGSGSGSTPHLAGELFKTQTNTKMVHVPYRGTGPAITAILSGEVSTMFMPALTALPLIQSGRVRALGVTSLERLPALPELPTVSESGLKGYQSSQWYGVLAPAGTSPDILNVLNGHTVRIMQSADMKERMKNSGSVAVGSSREVFAKFLQTEFSKWAQVIKASGATVD